MPNRNKAFSMISVPILTLIVFLASPFIVFSATINPVLYGANIPAAVSTSATGAITVYMQYVPLSPDSAVAIAP